MGIAITLSASEVMVGVNIGAMRLIANRRKGWKGTHGQDDKDKGWYNKWQKDIEGALAEMAVAKHLGLYWSGNIGDYSAADAGPYEVRMTSQEDGPLRVYDSDDPDDAYILAVGIYGNYDIVGWMWAKDAKRDEWYKLWRGAHFIYKVPQEALSPMETLPSIEEMLARKG